MRTRTVIVDNEAIGRSGTATLLGSNPLIDVVAILDHDEALAIASWADDDVAAVDAAAEEREGDQFPGVAVVEAIRKQRSTSETRIIILTARAFHPALRRRMREARADLLYNRYELARDLTPLIRAVLGQEEPGQAHLDESVEEQQALRELGVSKQTRVNAALAHADETEVGLFLNSGTAPRSNRRRITMRKRFDKFAQLDPRSTSGESLRSSSIPSWSQIERFYRFFRSAYHGGKNSPKT